MRNDKGVTSASQKKKLHSRNLTTNLSLIPCTLPLSKWRCVLWWVWSWSMSDPLVLLGWQSSTFCTSWWSLPWSAPSTSTNSTSSYSTTSWLTPNLSCVLEKEGHIFLFIQYCLIYHHHRLSVSHFHYEIKHFMTDLQLSLSWTAPSSTPKAATSSYQVIFL